MARSAVGSKAASEFVRWEEVCVSSDRGRREVHYYLKRRDGTSDLAVVGKEKSLRHMSYHYANRGGSVSPSSCLVKLRSRREVIDWLNSIVPGFSLDQSSQSVSGSFDSKYACELDAENLEDVQSRKLGQHTTEFLWLGSQWTCRKRRQHYQSFLRNGVKISVHDFVYVLAEQDKQLVAHLDDMYEDSRGNKMVVVRWFHKIDEVDILLPPNYNDREIFFSLCLQDLSIECIDGLATVLSPQHYEKFLNEAKHTQLELFVCHRQFGNDEIKPFDVTEVKGYWKQELTRHMFTFPPSKAFPNSQPPYEGLKVESNLDYGFGIRPRKRLRRLKDSDLSLQVPSKQDSPKSCLDRQCFGDGSIGFKTGSEKGAIMQKPLEHVTVGSQVEVLSQDSGIRGCWFRALIIKKHKDKVKVQYQDIKDAADEAKKLEEWVVASKVGSRDELGIRVCGRPTIRPTQTSNKGKVSWVVNVGTVVDAWWHDGWWEGIVVRKETEDKFHVYFPGEKKESIFSCSDLRHAQEWLGSKWKHLKERPDLVTPILNGFRRKKIVVKLRCGNQDILATCDKSSVHEDSSSMKDGVGFSPPSEVDVVEDRVKELVSVRDLSKDESLAGLRWKSSRKRRRPANSAQKHYSGSEYSSSSPEALDCETFFFPKSLKVDNDNCKYVRDSLFSSSVGPPVNNLVMSM